MNDLYIGVMSGTSMDGVDIALCRVDSNSCELICSSEYPFDNELKNDVLAAIKNSVSLKTVGELDTRLGKLFAEYINAFIRHYEIDPNSIGAIGIHGQTLWHEPDSNHPFSMQLGNANIITSQTGVRIVSDFRQKDIALGGQGAPLTPAFHKEMFSHINSNVAVLNIGGMANITILGEKLGGFDTGVGNVLLDYWIFKKQKQSYDKNGYWAQSGHVNNELLNSMLSDPYFSKPAPKSCGRELFNGNWLINQLKRFPHVIDEDVQATLLEFTATTIANEVKKTPTELLIVCGGGAKNSALMKKLQLNLKDIKVSVSDDYGISGDFMEAMAFAWLAYKRVHKEKVDIKSVTGAKENSLLGSIYE